MHVYLCLLYIISAFLNKLENRFPHFFRAIIAVLSLLGHLGHFVSQTLLFVSQSLLPFAMSTALEDWCMSIVEWHDSVCIINLTYILSDPSAFSPTAASLSPSLQRFLLYYYAACSASPSDDFTPSSAASLLSYGAMLLHPVFHSPHYLNIPQR